MAKWEIERRLDYIDFRLTRVGGIRREDIMRTFGVSVPMASCDLQEFLHLYPDSMEYDKHAKQYVAAGPGKYRSRRGWTRNTILAVMVVSTSVPGWMPWQ